MAILVKMSTMKNEHNEQISRVYCTHTEEIFVCIEKENKSMGFRTCVLRDTAGFGDVQHRKVTG